MGRFPSKMPHSCLNRIRPLLRDRSPPSRDNSTNEKRRDRFSDGVKGDSGGGDQKSEAVSGRKIMIVVDSKVGAKTAVQWALSHAVETQDTIILLLVKQADRSIRKDVIGPRTREFLTCMRSMCQLKRPEVHVEVAVVEGKDKGPAVVEEARRHGAALLVLGLRKRSVAGRLAAAWARKLAAEAGGVAEYCVENAGCMAIAVRRKSKKNGGYLITTKRHKEFWLLA